MKKMNLFLINKIIFFICLLTIILVALPLFRRGFFSYHDIQHLARLFDLDLALKNGQFPVRWVQNLGFGYGYPLFVFYPPLIYYFSEIFHLIGFSFINSFKIILFSGFLLSAFFIYLLAKDLFGKREAILASVLYLFLPYRAVTIYVRGAMAEFYSFVWLPAIFWALIKFDKTSKKRYLLLGSLFFSLLILTHSLIALPFCLFLFPFLGFLLCKRKFRNWKSLLGFVLLSLGLSAFFWIPSLIEKKYTIVDEILTQELASYKIHFVYPEQLWNSLWGYGGSAQGKLDGISFKIGKIHIILALFSIFIILARFIRKKKNNIYVYPLIVFLIFACFLTLETSRFFWDKVKPLWYLQFPWRFLIFVGFFISIIASYSLRLINNERFKDLCLFLILGIIIFFNLKLFKPQFYFPDKTDEDFTNQQRIRWEVSRSSFEYIPKGVKLKLSDKGTSIPNIEPENISNSIGEIINGEGNFNILLDRPQKKIIQVQALKDLTFRFNNFNFHGWQAKLDGQKTSVSDNNELKLITVIVPKGNHKLEIFYQDYLIIFANVVSLITLIIFIILLWKR